MAGPDPFNELFTSEGGISPEQNPGIAGGFGYTPDIYEAERQRRRERRRARRQRRLQRKQKREEGNQAEARILTGQWEDKPDHGFGAFRKLEAQEAAKTQPMTIEEAEKRHAENAEQYEKDRAILDEYRAETIALLKAGRLSDDDKIARDKELAAGEKYLQEQAKFHEADALQIEQTKADDISLANLYALLKLNEMADEPQWSDALSGLGALTSAVNMGKKLFAGDRRTLEEKLQDPEFIEEFRKQALDKPEEIQAALEVAMEEANEPGLMEKIFQNTPFAGFQQTVAGLASYPTEGLAYLTGADEDERGRFESQMTLEGAALNLNPIGFMANVLGVGTSDSELRKRGQEWNQKAASNLTDFEAQHLVLPDGTTVPEMISPIEIGLKMYYGSSPAGLRNRREIRNRIVVEATTDPLNFIDFGGGARPTTVASEAWKGAKTTELGRRMIKEYPNLLLPEKVWLKAQGRAREAGVLGTPMEKLHVAQEAMEYNTDLAALQFAQKMTEDSALILNGFKQAEREAILGPVSQIKELAGKNPLGRQAFEEAAKQVPEWQKLPEIQQAAAIDYAEAYAKYDGPIREWENSIGLQVADLDSVYGYADRELTDAYKDIVNADPQLRRDFYGYKGAKSRDMLETFLMRPEMRRKLRVPVNEAEDWLRAKTGAPPEMEVFRRDLLDVAAQRVRRSARVAQKRHATSLYVRDFAKVDPAEFDMLLGMTDDAASGRMAQRINRLQEAEEGLARAQKTREEFREGRKALGQAGKIADKQADKLVPTADRMFDVGQQADEVAFAQKAGGQMRRTSAVEAEHVLRTFADEAKERIRALAEGDVLETTVKAKAGKGQTAAPAPTPTAAGAYDLAWAKAKHTDAKGFVDAKAVANEVETAVRKAGGAEVVENGKRIKVDADMRDANGNQWGSVGAVMFPSKPGDGVFIAGATAPAAPAAAPATKAATAKTTKSKAPKLTKEIQRRAEHAADNYVKEIQRIQDDWWKNNPKAEFPKDAKAYARGTFPDYKRVVRQFKKELKAIAPKGMSREFDKMAGDVLRQVDQLATAKAAVQRPVAAAVGSKVTRAEKNLVKAVEAMEGADVHAYSPEAKLRWVRAVAEQNNFRLPVESAADMMVKAKVKLPESLKELVRLAVSHFDEGARHDFARYMADSFYDHINTPTKFGKLVDGVIGEFRRAQLSRPSSLMRDFWGTVVNVVMAGAHGYVFAARKALGKFDQWQSGKHFRDKHVMEMEALRILETRSEEAAKWGQGSIAILEAEAKNPNLKAILKPLAKVEEKGVIGSVLPGKLGGAAAEGTKNLLDARIYTEALGRVATYKKARAAGLSPQEAGIETIKYWGKFSELTQLERTVFNRLLYFWTWRLRSIPITMAHLLDHPVRSKWLLYMMAGNVHNDENLPDWAKRMGGINLGIDDNGMATVIGTGGAFYQSPTMAILQSDMANAISRGNFSKAPAAAAKDLIRSSPPPLQAPVEYVMDYNFFTGKKWFERYEDGEGVGSQVKAPGFMYWLKDTPIGEFFNVKESKDGSRVTFLSWDPNKAWVFKLIPGAEATFQDVSAFTDPRAMQDPEKEGPISFTKGIVRQGGMPVYHVKTTPEGERQIRELQSAIRKTVDKIPGHALYMTDAGDVVPSSRTVKGQQMRADMDAWAMAARNAGKSNAEVEKYVDMETAGKYPREWQLMELARLVRGHKRQLAGEKVRPPLVPADLGRLGGKIEPSIREQKIRELARRRR